MDKVKLIAYTHPSPVLQQEFGDLKMNLQEIIAYCARVSNPSNQMNTETSDKLLNYLINNHHWSPFETVSATLEINTTRDIAHQILRHRSFSFQEFSQRYADARTMGFEYKEPRLQDPKNRQNSVEGVDSHVQYGWRVIQDQIIEATKVAYGWAIENGIAKEVARVVLPEGMTQTRIYMAGTMRSWIHYISLRTAGGTQKEHREIALECADALEPVFPMIRGIKPVEKS